MDSGFSCDEVGTMISKFGNLYSYSLAKNFDTEMGESFPNPSDKEKSVAPVPASLSPSLHDSDKLKAAVSETDPAGELWPQFLCLMELGMDLDPIKRITRRFPRFPFYILEGQMPKSDIPSILNRTPWLCGFSLSENLIPTMAFLEDLGVNKKQWPKLICCFPISLFRSRQKVKTTVDFLYEMGLSAESIGKILTRFPPIIDYSVENKLRPVAQYFRFLGVDVAVLFLNSPSILGFSLETNLKPVAEFLERGYSMVEVVTMISRYGAL
ncbi:hypothetical protein FNV43_RR22263 [Rhamnella rubrinervis]|uniref:Uncharacterized protein n=1 Tax=Rhamnella rubrinervis TaxID=2594499 RepID=A0A8K0GRX1_9ROSA|nr:hypothetical protein FNV43_RR22263 [Rhamnella rubrinervis]